MSEIKPRAASEFAEAAAAHGIHYWPIRRCSICHYQLGYVFSAGGVQFDPGCDCTGGGGDEPRTWDDVAQHYNMQTNPAVRARYDAFWRFVEAQ